MRCIQMAITAMKWPDREDPEVGDLQGDEGMRQGSFSLTTASGWVTVSAG
jgi:hypothetical protein